MNRRATYRALAVRILCAVALLFVGFAHRPASHGMPSPFELAALVLPDGTFADLCIDDDAVDGKARHEPGKVCEACRIANAMVLPLPVDLHGASRALNHAVADAPVLRVAAVKRERPGAPPRAPPAAVA